MKITTFDPFIMSPKADDVIGLFEALGFERKHTKTGCNNENITDVRLKNEDGFHVDVSDVNKLPQDVGAIRMNVDDFDEAFDFLTAHGFKNTQGNKIGESPTSKGTAMVSPTGYIIVLSHHKKK